MGGFRGKQKGLLPVNFVELFQTKALMDRLQKTVSSEGRFKNLRETLKK